MRRLLLLPSLLFLAAPAGWGAPVRVAVDMGKAGAPISRYIYGQFIEHLGRGMYGGLWAEMLEDRKFLFIITDRYAPWGTTSDTYWGSGPYDYLRASPWRVIGPPGTVTMDTTHPFTGIHSPSVRIPSDGSAAGVAQPGLALLKGRSYSGRVVLSADAGASIVIRFDGGPGKAAEIPIGTPGRQFSTYPFQFTAPWGSDDAEIEILGTGSGSFEIGAVSLMPSDNVHGWRSDVLALLKELNAPIYRWPGGNFVSGYNWRDGIGDRDTRPPRQNPAWKGVESNDVGIHEFMDLMSLIGAEPYVCLNTGLATVEDAAAEVQYCVGSPDTPMGKLRAANGHPQPFPVTWWALGNEMYGSWQLGYMPVEQYVKKHNSLAEAIRRVDPAARLVAVGAVGAWDEAMLAGCAGSMDLISEHAYRKDLPDVDAHSRQLADDIERIAAAHRRYRTSIPALAGRDIRIAMDEYNYWYGPYVYGELGVQYHLKDALGIARALHAFFRNSDLFAMANYAQTVNVIGAIKASRTAAVLDTTGLVLKLYRNHYGTIPVSVTGSSGKLDIAAALTEDRKALTVAVVNAGSAPEEVFLETRPVGLAKAGTQWILTGPGAESFNAPGKPPQVTVVRSALTTSGSSGLEVPALSVVLFRFDLI